ncbi:hypothetical protein BT69DRAFT_1284541, partial [Atractiella rhizophila]
MTTHRVILQGGGVVRNVSFWGRRSLPQIMVNRTTNVWQSKGEYTELTFHANPKTLETLQKRLKLEPTVLRATTMRIGRGLKDITNASQGGSITYPPGQVWDSGLEEAMTKAKKANSPAGSGSSL